MADLKDAMDREMRLERRRRTDKRRRERARDARRRELFFTVDDVKRANERAGDHWFSKDTMRFFRSRIVGGIEGGRYFVTSERGPSGVRSYTVREALPAGHVMTVGAFQAYPSARLARIEAARLGKAYPSEAIVRLRREVARDARRTIRALAAFMPVGGIILAADFSGQETGYRRPRGTAGDPAYSVTAAADSIAGLAAPAGPNSGADLGIRRHWREDGTLCRVSLGGSTSQRALPLAFVDVPAPGGKILARAAYRTIRALRAAVIERRQDMRTPGARAPKGGAS